jgi:hypothetical protein
MAKESQHGAKSLISCTETQAILSFTFSILCIKILLLQYKPTNLHNSLELQ